MKTKSKGRTGLRARTPAPAGRLKRECEHLWVNFTPYKAECFKCGSRRPWKDLVKKAREEMFKEVVRELRTRCGPCYVEDVIDHLEKKFGKEFS